MSKEIVLASQSEQELRKEEAEAFKRYKEWQKRVSRKPPGRIRRGINTVFDRLVNRPGNNNG